MQLLAMQHWELVRVLLLLMLRLELGPASVCRVLAAWQLQQLHLLLVPLWGCGLLLNATVHAGHKVRFVSLLPLWAITAAATAMSGGFYVVRAVEGPVLRLYKSRVGFAELHNVVDGGHAGQEG